MHGGDRRGGAEPEVVVAVPVDGDVEAVERPRDEERRGLGRGDPERVDDDDLGRARPYRGRVRAVEELDDLVYAKREELYELMYAFVMKYSEL